jgi:hypothetical protein
VQPTAPDGNHHAPCALVGQGNRVKKLCGDEACEEVVIPGGDFAAESEGILSPGSPDQVEGHVLMVVKLAGA